MLALGQTKSKWVCTDKSKQTKISTGKQNPKEHTQEIRLDGHSHGFAEQEEKTGT